MQRHAHILSFNHANTPMQPFIKLCIYPLPPSPPPPHPHPHFSRHEAMHMHAHITILSVIKLGHTLIGGSCHKHYFCRDTVCLSRDKHICLDTRSVSTSILLSRQKTCFVATNTCWSRQKYACRDKTFVATKLCLSRQIFVVTNVFSLQKYFVATKN